MNAGLMILTMLCAAQTTPEAAHASMSLVLDDAPNLVYIDAAITLSLRIVNEGDAAPFKLLCSLRNEAGADLWSREIEGNAPEARSWRTEITCRPGDDAANATELRVALTTAGKTADDVSIRLARPNSNLPGLKVEGARFVDKNGARVLFRIDRRVRPPSTRWMIVKWIDRKLSRNVVTAPKVLLVGDSLSNDRATSRTYLDRLAKDVTGLRAVTVWAGKSSDRLAQVTGPLRAVAGMFTEKIEPAKMAVIFIGNHCYECGSDVLDYRRSLELIIQRLEARGTGHFVIVPPIAPPHWRRQTRRHHREAEKVAWHYSARIIELDELIGDSVWLRPDDPAGVMLRDPSAQGHRTIADTLAAQLAKIRRP